MKHNAFPIISPIGKVVQPGITVIDWLATFAPDKIPSWFKPDMEPKPKVRNYLERTFGKTSSHKHRELYVKFYCDEGDMWHDPDNQVPQSFKEEVAAYDKERSEELEAEAEWHRRYDQEIYFQWRIFYANSMAHRLGYKLDDEEIK